MSEFFTILPPPQSIDTLDAWGGLDSLSWSLDSAVWTQAGLYGLVASEGGTSGEELRGAQRIRTLNMAGTATAGGSFEGEKAAAILDLEGKAEGRSGGDASLCLVRMLSLVADTGSGEGAGLVRVLSIALDSSAESTESALFTFKGWGWNGATPKPAPEWTPETEEPGLWVQKGQNVAVWTA